MNKGIVWFVISLLVVAGLVACGTSPDANQIKADLIGKKTMEWSFDSMGEFQKFDIIKTSKQGDIVEYTIALAVRDMNTGKPSHGELFIVYKKESDKWQIVNVVIKNWVRG